MDKHKAQLEQVNYALAVKPENKQLLKLKDKIEKILSLKSTESSVKNGESRQITEHTSDFPLQIGEACEIFDESVKYWRPGHIVSMTLDRDFYIISYKKGNVTQRVSGAHVRRPLLRESKVPSAVRKLQVFKSRKEQPEPEGLNQWKKFSDKTIKK